MQQVTSLSAIFPFIWSITAWAGAPALATFLTPAGWPAIITAVRTQETLGPGVTHERWRLTTASGPLAISIATVDLRNPFVGLAVETQHAAITGPDEALSAMADRLHAQAGINGDYFDINGSGSPLNIVVAGRRVEHQPSRAAAFIVGAGSHVTMGPIAWQAQITSARGDKLSVGVVNEWSANSSVSLLTSRMGTTAAGGATEVVLVPTESAGRYRVSKVATNLSALAALGPSDLALAARGDAAQTLQDDFQPGDAVDVNYQWNPPLDSVIAAIGGGPLLLHGREPVEDPFAPAAQETNVRYPVSGVGLSADGATLWLLTVDGRSPRTSVGITRPMLGALLAALGASDAMAFDSGGSAEMVVRHLGDPGVSVANVPSDGRQRAVADGLFVLNTAPIGAPARTIVRAAAPAVLAGSHLQLRTAAVDSALQPVPVDPSKLGLRFSAGCNAATIDENGLLTAIRPGCANVSATYPGAAPDELALVVVPAVARLSIVGYGSNVPVGEKVQLSVAAQLADGAPVAVDASAVIWSSHGVGGRIDAEGTFFAGPVRARVGVSARAGGKRAELTVLVGEHAVRFALAPAAWRYAASPKDVPGLIDDEPAPDGGPALHLGYDFSVGGGTRAAYGQTSLALNGEPLAVSIDVYGDGQGEWLRGGYRNADGIGDSVTLARRVDWQGWRSIRVAIPQQARLPIVWTRLYVVEPRMQAIERGSVWFRNFDAMYPGP